MGKFWDKQHSYGKNVAETICSVSTVYQFETLNFRCTRVLLSDGEQIEDLCWMILWLFLELIGFMNNKNFYRKSFEDSLEDFTPWANRFKELPLYFMTFHGQEDFEIVKEVGILLCLSDLNFFCFTNSWDSYCNKDMALHGFEPRSSGTMMVQLSG